MSTGETKIINPSLDLPDVLKRGDIIGVIWDKPGFISKAIVKHQLNREGLRKPYADISHVLIVSNPWRFVGYEEWPPRGGRVDIIQKYKGCRLKVFRFNDWKDDEERTKLAMDIVDDIICHCGTRYNYIGVGLFVFGMSSNADDTYFCSQVIVDGYINYGKPLIENLPGAKCSPGRLCCSTRLRNELDIIINSEGRVSLDYNTQSGSL